MLGLFHVSRVLFTVISYVCREVLLYILIFTDRERKVEWQSWNYQPRRSVFRVHTLNGARVLNTKIYVYLFIYIVTVSLSNPQGL